jgi:hypothetical protein
MEVHPIIIMVLVIIGIMELDFCLEIALVGTVVCGLWSHHYIRQYISLFWPSSISF